MEKAALSLVAAVVSPVITKLSDVAASYFGGDISRKELRHLQTNIIPKIQTVIQQAEKIDAPTLKPWLMELQAAAYEAEDLLDMYEYNKIKNDVSRLPTSLKNIKGKAKEMLAPLLLKTQLKKSLEKLKQAADDADKLIHLLDLVNATTTKEDIAMRSHPQQRISVSGLSSPVFGRDQDCDALVKMLITEPNDSSGIRRNVTTHAIHGIGGAGKTTLAQRVYNDERVNDHFGLKIWIHISRTFDTHKITKEIIESIEKGACSPVGTLEVLQNKLKELLTSKRFLLVLDDVWTEDRQLWDLLLVPLSQGTEVGSRILITARMERMMRTAGVKDENILSLNELRIEECRSIFKYYAFDDPNKAMEDPELADICEKILCKLKNSPLAARLTGSLLRQSACTVGAWKRILNNDLLGETLDVILMSFQHLPPHLQRCFALCSLYPKGWEYYDCSIYVHHDINDMVNLWIAQGYVEATDNESLEDRGRQYFDDLLSYSLFQSHPTEKGFYVMHDLVHDVSEMVSENYCFRVEGDNPVNIPATVVHLSIAVGELDMHMSNILELRNLRTFISSENNKLTDLSEQIVTMFKKLRKLRVLQFWRWHVSELNNSVGQLKHLRHLRLKVVEKLPESLGSLYHLRYLDVVDSNIIKVPKSLNNLVKLQCLFPNSLCSKIDNIGKLVSLQTLEVYHGDRTKKHGLQQLRNLQQIKVYLTIEGLENIRNKAEASDAMLNKKRHLDRLILGWDNNRDVVVGMDRDTEVLEGLEPHPNLKMLEINGYRGAKLPSWVGIINSQERLPNLTSLNLCFCYDIIEISHLPGLLKELIVNYCPNLVEILNFPGRLKMFTVEKCPKLKTSYPFSLEKLVIEDDWEIKVLLSSANDDDRQEPFPLKYLDIRRVSILDEKSLNGFLMNDRLSSLSYLSLCYLTSITSLRMGPHFEALRHLHIVGLDKLKSVKDMEYLTSLDSIRVTECPKLTQTLAGVGGCIPSHIRKVEVDDLMMLPGLFQEQCLNSLVDLVITGWSQDIALSAEQEGIFLHLTSLECLEFNDCKKLPSLPGTLEKLSSLKSLHMLSCKEIESLPSLPCSLSKLHITNCHPRLAEKYKAGGPLCHHINNIPNFFTWSY